MRSPRVKSIEIESLIPILFKVATLRWARGKRQKVKKLENLSVALFLRIGINPKRRLNLDRFTSIAYCLQKINKIFKFFPPHQIDFKEQNNK